jgi:hypothetical protein
LTHLSQLFLVLLLFMLKIIVSTPVYGQNSPTFSQEIASLVKRITHGVILKGNLAMKVLPVVAKKIPVVTYYQ